MGKVGSVRKDLLVNDSGDRQAVEAIGKGLPELDVIPAFAFVVKAVNSVDAGAFVVASEDKEVFWVFDLRAAIRIKKRMYEVHCIPCTLTTSRWFPDSASLCPHSLPRRGNSLLGESRHTRTDVEDRNIGRGCRLYGSKTHQLG